MKVVILAGGFGTRLSEYTDSIPKPMVTIGGKPILLHIMEHFASFGHKEFIIALGYKSEFIKNYFLSFHSLNSDFKVDLSNGEIDLIESQLIDWKVSLIDTGLNSHTGERVRRLKRLIGNDTFLLTYGDGVSDVNIDKLVNFHKKNGKMVTLTAVRPNARFGELIIKDDIVTSFKEKPQTSEGWINGGFFVLEPEFIDLIKDNNAILEREPLEEASSLGQLMAYKHFDFWHCMDSKRDKDNLEEIYQSRKGPWKNTQE